VFVCPNGQSAQTLLDCLNSETDHHLMNPKSRKYRRCLRLIGVSAVSAAVALAALQGLLAVTGVDWVLALGPGLCGEELVSSVPSPGNRYVAEVFRRDCGATTSGRTRHVNLHRKGTLRVTWDGTLSQGVLLYDETGGPLGLEWKGPKHLTIRRQMSEPGEAVHRWRDVTITYESIPIEIRHRKTRAVLHRVQNLWHVRLPHANLSGADLASQNLKGSDLRAADLRGADLEHTDLRGADLRDADLRGAQLEWAHLEAADLRNARLDAAGLGGAYYSQSTRWSTGVDLRRFDMIRLPERGQSGLE
jgi:hypothetical protein